MTVKKSGSKKLSPKKSIRPAKGSSASNGKAEMADYKSAFAAGRKNAAEYKGGGGENVKLDDGNYVCRLTSASVNFTLDKRGNPVPKNEGKMPGFSMRFVVLRGEDKGQQPSTWSGLHSEIQVSILVNQLALLAECDPEDIELAQLPELAEQLSEAKPIVRLQAKTTTNKKGTFTNYTIREVLEDEEDDE